MKRNMTGNPTGETEIEDMEMPEIVLESSHIPKITPRNPHMLGEGRTISYRDTLQRNNPNLDFETRENPIWEVNGSDYVSELKRRLKIKKALKEDFSLINIGHDYYVTRFTNPKDYEHKIGSKIGKVRRVDNTIANVERRQFTRLSVEVDLTKPLLSKFRLNGRVWRVQYEGLWMVCFKCSTQGHKEKTCPLVRGDEREDVGNNKTTSSRPSKPEEETTYGSWMLVRKSARWKHARQQA
ncbi:hypothetical protein Cgig2_033548 [Carnegiea gigantea]|uniref:CCHC-type domain-containing protein n=1 Tax=Carnegiea gigantea TaxID=171969 RepID=A0A9Q1K1P9_9CARY|nr:hypothetical protein Cgig2_033548 [Carnegiea gigantea]